MRSALRAVVSAVAVVSLPRVGMGAPLVDDAGSVPAAVPQPLTPPAPVSPEAAPGLSLQTDDEEEPGARPPARAVVRSPARQEEHAGGRIAVAIVTSVVSLSAAGVAFEATSGDARWWAGAGALIGGAVGTGLITCALGKASRTREGRCGPSVVGALLGAATVLPGIALIRHSVKDDSCRRPDTKDDSCALGGIVEGALGLVLASGGYVVGTSLGAEAGWRLGSTQRKPGFEVANLTLVSLQF